MVCALGTCKGHACAGCAVLCWCITVGNNRSHEETQHVPSTAYITRCGNTGERHELGGGGGGITKGFLEGAPLRPAQVGCLFPVEEGELSGPRVQCP